MKTVFVRSPTFEIHSILSRQIMTQIHFKHARMKHWNHFMHRKWNKMIFNYWIVHDWIFTFWFFRGSLVTTVRFCGTDDGDIGAFGSVLDTGRHTHANIFNQFQLFYLLSHKLFVPLVSSLEFFLRVFGFIFGKFIRLANVYNCTFDLTFFRRKISVGLCLYVDFCEKKNNKKKEKKNNWTNFLKLLKCVKENRSDNKGKNEKESTSIACQMKRKRNNKMKRKRNEKKNIRFLCAVEIWHVDIYGCRNVWSNKQA